MADLATSFQNPFFGNKTIFFEWGGRVGDDTDLLALFGPGTEDLRHRGVDYGISNYQSVLATAAGKVVAVEQETSGFGTYIVIKHTKRWS